MSSQQLENPTKISLREIQKTKEKEEQMLRSSSNQTISSTRKITESRKAVCKAQQTCNILPTSNWLVRGFRTLNCTLY